MRFNLRRFGLIGTLAMVTALVVAACGGGGDPTAEPGAPQPQAPLPTATAAPTATLETAATAGPAPTAKPTPVPRVTLAPPAPTATPVGVQIKRGGILTVRLLIPFEPWDTYNLRSQFSTEFTLNFWSNLMALRTEEPSVIEPDLVERWEVGVDGKTITLHLTPGTEWHDGTPFTAQDVVFNLNRAKNPASALLAAQTGRMKRLQTFEAIDDATVRLTLDQVSVSFLVNLSAPFMLMYPAHIVTESKDIIKNPIGTGPFVVTNYKSDQTISTVAYENYHRKDSEGRALPFVDGIDFIFIRDNSTALAACRTGRIDCGCGY
ncbi:MAG: ABC transporter substrate-binding protein, partial [Chloroflexi bacterium]|nr:ABC transporter substrate-binding protein [Chloroflexota bacterium]